MGKIVDKEFQRKLWATADALRGNISSENYMHIVIGLMFLKHMSDKYELALKGLEKKYGDKWLKLSKNKDFLQEFGVSFVIPENASWKFISRYSTSPEIGQIIDNAFLRIEESNPELKGLLDKNYNRPELDQSKLGQVVTIFSDINLEEMGEDIIGRTYEYFLGEFFLKQGQTGGEFYTPKSIVDLIVRLVNPGPGKIYDPTAGTGGMLVQARMSVSDENKDKIVAYGQEYQNKTWRLSKVNLLLHGFNIANIKLGSKSADTFTEDLHADMKFDYVMANPPFNVKVWGYDELVVGSQDKRWKWGNPPKGNANYAFISHIVDKLDDNGRGATVLANGSLSGSGNEEKTIRENLVNSGKNGYIDAIISLPDKLFYTTGIPVCIWVFNKNKKNDKILMINASGLQGEMLSKKNRKLTNEDLDKITNFYKKHIAGEEIEELGFAKSVSKNELDENNWSFVPSRYVGIEKSIKNLENDKNEILNIEKKLESLFSEMNDLIPSVMESIKKMKED